MPVASGGRVPVRVRKSPFPSRLPHGGGAVLVVKKGVQASAKGTVYVLERMSDGARASVEVSGKAASGASCGRGHRRVCQA